MSRWARWIVLLAAVTFAASGGVNAVRKGGDFAVYLDSGERFLQGTTLYSDSGVGAGVIGPPFQAAVFTIFALVARANTVVAQLTWYLTNLALGVFGISWWVRALAPTLHVAVDRFGIPLDWQRILIPLLAIAFPLQTNFEHQNLNVVLLAVVGGVALATASGRTVLAGLLAGLATALKAFPALLIVTFLGRRSYRASVSMIGATVVLTAAALARYGTVASETLRGWLALNAAGNWPIRGNNQSLFAMLARYFGPEGLLARGHLPRDSHPWIYLLWLFASGVLVATVCWKSWQWRVAPLAPIGLAAALVVAVLVSPIAWDHYWTLLFPAFFVVWNARRRDWSTVAFYAAAVLTSGFSRMTVGASGLAVARGASVLTWAGLILFAAIVAAGDHLAHAPTDGAADPAPPAPFRV